MPNSDHKLSFRAGPGAISMIRENGFAASQIGTFAGASGGAKWLILSQLDRVVGSTLLPRLSGPVHTIGSSIGAWRFACYGQADPLAAIDRFEDAYLSQTYTEKPGREEISAKTSEILDYILGEGGVTEVLSNPVLRTNIMAVRSKHVLAAETGAVLVPALLFTALSNAVYRKSLGAFFERALFYDERSLPPFYNAEGFPIHRVPLAANNLKASILATGAIPMVLNAIRDIPGAPKGVYRDGGIIDYHLDIPQSSPGRLTFYLHFIDRIVPGWFDKNLSRRRPLAEHVENTLLISPSRSFVETLPNAKIPDRQDFVNYPPAEREKNWRIVVDRCRELADELHDVIETNRMADRLEPLI